MCPSPLTMMISNAAASSTPMVWTSISPVCSASLSRSTTTAVKALGPALDNWRPNSAKRGACAIATRYKTRPDGVPGREKSYTPRLYSHLSGILTANSEPLSVFSSRGRGRLNEMPFRIASTTSSERRFCPSQIPRDLIYGSITFNKRASGHQTAHRKQNPAWIYPKYSP
jgi:hypothetical protein